MDGFDDVGGGEFESLREFGVVELRAGLVWFDGLGRNGEGGILGAWGEMSWLWVDGWMDWWMRCRIARFWVGCMLLL